FRRGERQVNDVFKAIFPDLTPPLAKSQTKTPMLLNINTQSHFETFALGPYQFPRLLNGLWQLSSSSWGSGSDKRQEEELIRLVQSGFTAADMADHYGDAELVYANFRNRLSPSVRSQVLAATKWCVFTPLTQPLTSLFVLEKVKERYRRLGGRVELLQFDWYDYSCKDYLNILVELVRLTAIYPNLVSTIGLCNFDSEHTVEVCEYLIAKTGSVGIVSNQVQFSLIDSRPLQLMVNVCAKYGLKLLTYGSLVSLQYHDMIMSWGTWQDFQSLLYELSAIADEHRVTLTNIATRWILQQPSVGALIVGTRLGVSNHVDDNLATFGFTLNAWDLDRIEALALGISRGKTRRLFSKLGDCGTEYRNEN
ncbi:aldo/keto reductase/Endoribonuclease L-PSP, partial [Colletotrichum higginsianum]